jgi:hypothetical protein
MVTNKTLSGLLMSFLWFIYMYISICIKNAYNLEYIPLNGSSSQTLTDLTVS